jgi:hypothetical protein
VARFYAALAEEAARSVEFQRWLSVLTSSPGLDALVATTLAPEMTRTLTRARDALLCYSYDPILESAITDLERFIQTCYPAADQSTAPPLSWPLTLLRQVIAHGQMLSTHHNSTTSMRLLS